jgi:hypothetical protein
MNLLSARVVLRLRSVPDLLDLALKLCVDSASVYRRISAALLLPAFAACVALRYAAHVSWWEIWPIAISLAAILQGAYTAAAGGLMFEEAAPARTLLGRFGKRLPAYLGGLFVARGLLAFWMVLAFLLHGEPWLVVLWISFAFLLIRTAFVHEALLLEGADAFEARRRAIRLMRRHGGAVLGLLFWQGVALIAYVVGAELIGQGVMEFVLQLGKPFGSLWDDGGSLFALAGLFASVPFLATARFLQYIDLRTRKEGWDIQLRFTAIQAEAQDRRMAA